MRLLAVVNAASAGGRTARRWPAIRAALEAAGIEVETAFTERPGHAAELARDGATSGRHEIVAACGGDGTLSEVVGGLIDATGTPVAPAVKLAVLPSGTGGDFRKTLEIPTDAAAGAAVIASGRTRQIDAGIIEYADGSEPRRFVNIASCGVGYEVDRRINELRVKPGKLAYALVSLRTTLAYTRVPASVRVDDEVVTGEFLSVACANGRYFGGGMHIAPDADPSDGLLDVVLSEAPPLRAVLDSRHLYAGTHIGRHGTRLLRGREVEITPEPDRKMGFDVDGEPLGFAPARLRCLPGVLSVCC